MSNEGVIASAQLHGAEYAEARRLYKQAHGWTLTGRPSEADGAPQARLDLANSGLLAVAVPAHCWFGGDPYCGQVTPPAVQALGEIHGTAALDTGATVTLLYSVPVLPDGAPRRLVLDMSVGAGLASFRAAEGNQPLPHAGTKERWLRFATPAAAPAFIVELASALADDGGTTDRAVARWLIDHFEPSGPTGLDGLIKRIKGDPIVGLSRDDVHSLLLSVTSWTAADFPADRLSRCADRTFIDKLKHRTGDGYIWQIARKPGVVLSKPNGVAAETVDPLLLEHARALHVAREHSPDRVRARREERELREKAAREAADLALRYGTRAMADSLAEQQDIEGHGKVRFAELLARAEPQRRTACLIAGVKYRPIDLMQARAAWWENSGPIGTPHDERYGLLVAWINAQSDAKAVA